MKKVATITFHWATNYGAVLQAYALQKYLEKCGIETEIIDYIPFRVKLLSIYSWLKTKNVSEFKKERLIKKFRKSELKLSKKKYWSCKALKKEDFDYKCVICGSDQIWNKNFTMYLNGKPNLSYFLDFVDEHIIKIGYAISFGSNCMPKDYFKLVKPYVKLFNAISVREESAMFLTQKMEITSPVVCDPTLLLDRHDYEVLIKDKVYEHSKMFCYVLHSNQSIITNVINETKKFFGDISNESKPLDLYEWLYKIRNSEMFITNSFHGVMMSLIFNTPFIAVHVEGADMNDRIITILEVVGLKNRFIDCFCKEKIHDLVKEEIDWDRVNIALQKYSLTGKKFLLNSMKGI